MARPVDRGVCIGTPPSGINDLYIIVFAHGTVTIYIIIRLHTAL